MLFLSPWGEALEMRFLDLWFQVRGTVAPPKDVVVVAMDEDSYDVLGFSPNQTWPRAAHEALLNRLATAGARKVIFDVLFFGDGPSVEIDEKLAAAMHRVPTIIGADVGEVEEEHYAKKGLLLPSARFREAATVALIGLPEDGEHIRRFLLPKTSSISEITGDLPSLASAASGTDVLPGRRDLLRYYGPQRSVRTYSYYQALETERPLPPGTFRDKIVFVGLSLQTGLGPAQKDAYLTSFPGRGRTFGVEIHATAAANLLHGDWIRRSSVVRETSLLALAAALITFVLLRVSPGFGALIVGGYALGWGALAYGFFLRGTFLPGAVLAVIILPLAYTKATLTNYLIARLQQLRLQRAFKFYLSPEMAEEVAQNPQALKLGGEEIECTALFTDIAGFTNIVESMEPSEVGRMLNAYFTEVMDAIFEQRGTLIKFIGDAVYALWGAPIRSPNHARLCCEAALAIQDEIERFIQSGRFPPLHTRFGINTGPMLVGNMGSARRFDFTGIGDSVNLASRVEGLNKYFGTTILITDSTRAQLPPEMVSLKLGLIRVVGKTQPIGLHTLLRQPVSPAIATRWAEACVRFVARDWVLAGEIFAFIGRDELRLSKAAELYLHQIELHQNTPPTSEWQGEIIFTSK